MSFSSWNTVNWLWGRDYSQVLQPIISEQPHASHFQSLQFRAFLSFVRNIEHWIKWYEPVVRSIYLKVGYSHSCNHSKHNKEHPSNDRLWNGNKDCSKFSKDSQNQHENSSHLEDQSAAHLPEISRIEHSIHLFFPFQVCFLESRAHACWDRRYHLMGSKIRLPFLNNKYWWILRGGGGGGPHRSHQTGQTVQIITDTRHQAAIFLSKWDMFKHVKGRN